MAEGMSKLHDNTQSLLLVEYLALGKVVVECFAFDIFHYEVV